MDFLTIPLFSVMKSKLNYISEQQVQLAKNVSNADTPNYKAKDVKAPDFKSMVSGGGNTQQIHIATTNAKHLSGGGMSGGNGQIITRDSTYELSPSGNNVSIEEEMAKIAENQSEYTKVLNLYRKTVDMFKTAIGKTG